MVKRESKAQKDTIERVMHEAKHGELKTARGRKKVTSRKQAIAIALNEAGASKFASPKQNRRNLARTKGKEGRGETYQDEAEGGRGKKTGRSKSSRTTGRASTRGTVAKRRPRR